ncbi:MAG: AMP-binding protein [Planctomycetota bacterium]|jgi:acyl-CoA synthetase (AMP-forming)/AMP-acid ligase II|nr:AMP-binding protein [Planctomycetota bacterium]
MSTPVNISLFLREQARQEPDRPALVFCRGDGRRRSLVRQSLTFGELEAAVNKAAQGLARAGFSRGCRTLFLLPPSPAFFIGFFALVRIGAVPVLIDPGMGLGRLLAAARTAHPSALVSVSLAQAASCLLPTYFPDLQRRVTAGRRWFWGGPRWRDIMAGPEIGPFSPPGGDADLAAILFTSGSTGPAKGVEYSHAALSRQVELIGDTLAIGRGDIDCATFPGFSLFTVALGITAAIPDINPVRPGFCRPDNVLAVIRELGCTMSFGSPALWRRVADHAAREKTSLPSLQKVVMAGAPVPVSLHQTLLTGVLSPGAEVFTPYGATECMPVANCRGSEILADTAEQTARGGGVCLGRPVRGLEVAVIRISDQPIPAWHDDLCCPPGEIGEITVKAGHASPHYHNLPAADLLAKIPDQEGFWHRMGDVGYLDQLGRLWFCGRKSHRVTTPDGTLFSVPCEAVFNHHPQVARSALVGVAAGNGLERPFIIIERRPGARLAPDSLRQELLSLASANPLTQNIRDILFHPAFPVDVRHNAKINREALAVWAARAASGHAGRKEIS